jgi:hypothetical protein
MTNVFRQLNQLRDHDLQRLSRAIDREVQRRLEVVEAADKVGSFASDANTEWPAILRFADFEVVDGPRRAA